MMNPSPLSLSENPNPDLISHIEQYGGKLGVLELISKLYQKNPKPFDEIGIKVGPQYTPTIILPGKFLDELGFGEFSRKHELSGKSAILVRGSLPGDSKSLVDLVPTKKIKSLYPDYYNAEGHTIYNPEQATRIVTVSDQINETIKNIRNQVGKNIGFISRYAGLAGVPFDITTLSFGIVPEFSDNHIVITEHPNLADVFIEEYFDANAFRPKYVEIGKKDSRRKDGIGKVSMLLELLRNQGILDREIAYSLELGSSDDHGFVLYQVRELCKKISIESESLKLTNYHSDSIGTILTTIPIGATRDFSLGNNENAPINTKVGIPVLGKFRLSAFDSNKIALDPNRKGLLTENSGYPTIGGHHVMRQAQYALQSKDGGIVILGKEGGDKNGRYIDILESGLKPQKKYNKEGYPIDQIGKPHISVTHSPEGVIILKKLS